MILSAVRLHPPELSRPRALVRKLQRLLNGVAVKYALTPLAFLSLSGCDMLKEYHPEWQGWVYPDENNLTDDIPIGRFATLQDCRATATQLVRRLGERRDENGDEITGDYECGFQCKPDNGIGGLNVCERTEK